MTRTHAPELSAPNGRSGPQRSDGSSEGLAGARRPSGGNLQRDVGRRAVNGWLTTWTSEAIRSAAVVELAGAVRSYNGR